VTAVAAALACLLTARRRCGRQLSGTARISTASCPVTRGTPRVDLLADDCVIGQADEVRGNKVHNKGNVIAGPDLSQCAGDAPDD